MRLARLLLLPLWNAKRYLCGLQNATCVGCKMLPVWVAKRYLWLATLDVRFDIMYAKNDIHYVVFDIVDVVFDIVVCENWHTLCGF